MEPDKQQRHHHDHDHHTERERPASTDMADIIKDEKAAQAASAHQRRHAGKHAVDERFGEGAKSDVHGRILKVDVVSGRTRITIGAGHDQGVRPGMEGYIKVGAGMLADFQIEAAEAVTSVASVDLAPEAVYGNTDVILNPSAKPAPAKDLRGRIIGNSIEGGQVKLMIGLGAGNGVVRGMKGFMHAADNDKPYADFVVGEVTPRVSYAHVKLNNLDEVQRNPQVVLNPSSAAEAAKDHPAKPHHA
jgi:hypothetical protein